MTGGMLLVLDLMIKRAKRLAEDAPHTEALCPRAREARERDIDDLAVAFEKCGGRWWEVEP